jgi:hypothetical protein
LFYLHYTSFLLLLAQAVCWAALRTCHKTRVAYSTRQAACDAALIALLILPATPHLLAIAERRENWTRIVRAWPLPPTLRFALLVFGAIPVGISAWGRWRSWQRTAFELASVPGMWAVTWFLAPIALAWLATLSHVAALCLVRYLVASLAGGIVLAALCVGLFRNRCYQTTLASFLVLSTIVTGGMIQQFRRDGRLIGDRNEAWDRVTPWIYQRLQVTPHPVFLCAGLLEDTALQHQTDSRFVDYCLFPLSGIYRLQAARLEPLPTTPSLALTSSQRHLVAREGGLWLIVRAGPHTTQRIVAALLEDLSRGGATLHVGEQRRFGIVAVVHLSR